MTRLIDADALYMYERLKSYYGDAWRDAQKEIDNAPTVDAEPVRHGKWVCYPECLKYENALDDSYIVCSVCKEPFNIIDNDTERFDYCPHCGARMEKQK